MTFTGSQSIPEAEKTLSVVSALVESRDDEAFARLESRGGS